ncbi:tobe domain family [Treponema primitia ZAS-2]|uniref:Tobe domain family n=1 Tax=Treponema primitia (strain ATCC BAA-887 / DSM 12427 / ZAS-2) TaxID=545694 RepID=F5YPH1_TREPZ|nr:ABC transporter ATP-binding protein [Treponema primitia]AEF85535.1 tobe domain family [Treponema primitia ZAS-2]
MPEIILKNVTKMYGKFAAVDNLNLTITDGSFVTLLGPSGCGKTTTLRMIAGLETPTEGEITIDGKIVYSSEKGTDVSPAKRDVGFLFQNYALWPHMTVEQNIGFGLENMKWSKEKIRDRIAELLGTLKIEALGKRYPSELSGGQQQRVAIARTLATNPSVLFMDEPLSNLDAKLRTEMRSELKRLHAETHATFVYVTHDQLEAMTLSTKTCLMKEGIVQQYAPPLEVYNNPANAFVGDFVGSPTMNFIDGDAQSSPEGIHVKAQGLDLLFTPAGEKKSVDGTPVTLGIRPEFIRIDNTSKVKARIYAALPSGMETIVKISLGKLILTLVVFGAVDYQVDAEIGIAFAGDNCILFDKASGNNLGLGKLSVV